MAGATGLRARSAAARKWDMGVGVVALGYVALDYWRERAAWLPGAVSASLQPLLWSILAGLALLRAPRYPFWAAEIRAAPRFFLSVAAMVLAIACEVTMVQFATVVLGLDWHRENPPLPDTGQWVLLALNDMVPAPLRWLLRMRVIELHHFLMLFIMLGFSVLFGCIQPPGLGLAARYCLTMAIGRTLRFVTFVSTILPAVRPWCTEHRFAATTARHPHPWAQKYYTPYVHDQGALYRLLQNDALSAEAPQYPPEYIPSWGLFQFLVPFLRPLAPPAGQQDAKSWVIRPGGGCNDLAYSGHVLVAVLTACAWQEAKGGWEAAAVWFLVLHSAQREIRERQHYSVDVVVALYVGVLLWNTTAWLYKRRTTTGASGSGITWMGSAASTAANKEDRAAAALAPSMQRLVKAAKDWDMETVRSSILAAAKAANWDEGRVEENEAEAEWALAGRQGPDAADRQTLLFGLGIIAVSVGLCLLAFHLTVGG